MWQMGRGRQKATATCEATFEQVGKNTGTGGEKSKKRDVCVVGDGGEKAMRSQREAVGCKKLGPPVGQSFGLDLE